MVKDLFLKPIDRDIKGVIKVGQADNENIKQELEEYVVTRELQKHFAQFFSSYKKGINGNTDKMGVWISGFFGSGKSHFLKILSYLLANKEVGGKKALDYFLDDQKIADPMVMADMKLATTIADQTDVILFNIDSKSEMTSKQSKDAIVSVFLKVFNEMQGFSGSNPYLADLERHLSEEGKYQEFKEAFKVNFGKEWLDSRSKFDFIEDSIVEVLSEINFMSESAARNWCEKATEQYNISIENFAKLIKNYIDKKGNNHHIVFLVDEIGQYIGDDSKLMLNLQTVTEDLGTACHGKAWVVVTSQQDIDAIAKDMGLRSNDFSKIQGRFDTRLSLSSANVDEVIKKRILAKKESAEQMLKLLFNQKSTIIKNLIVFNDGIEKKLYGSDEEFASVYPFVPYQFNLLASVLTSIRTHGASGKHLSEGERSMIALFKESAMAIKDKEKNTLVPFNIFYDALHQFLDHSHKGVIMRAQDNSIINPDNEHDCFNVNVLKTLFMIKYVKEIKANVDNITSLMIDNIDADRIALKKKVEEALGILVRQMLVQKNGDIYIFLTDEEQEINREIENQNIEMSEVISKVSELIYEDIFTDKKYRYPSFGGRYNFAFNQTTDDRPYKSNQNNDIGVTIITPNAYYGDDEITLRMRSGQNKEVLVVLPPDSVFLEELRSSLKIEKYLRLNTSANLSKFELIKESKRIEMRDRKANAKIYLTEGLKNADIYVNGDKISIPSKEVTARINDALATLVATVYHKLNYITTPMSETNIRELFSQNSQQSFSIEDGYSPNKNALNDMLNLISRNSQAHTKTSLKTLHDTFMKAPYGFVEDDVEWLVAKLFRDGDIALTVNGSSVTMLNKTEEEIIRFITKREYVDKVMVEKRQRANDAQKKSVREVFKELFNYHAVIEDDDSMMKYFQSYGKDILNELEKIELQQKDKNYPGVKIVQKGKALLRSVIQLQSPMEFFSNVHRDRDDYLDFSEDYILVKEFFKGDQIKIFNKAFHLIGIYDESKTFIVEEDVEELAKDIKAILIKEQPYSEIHKLPMMLEKFEDAYYKVLASKEEPVIEAIKDAKERVMEVLENKPYKEELKDRYLNLFNELSEKQKSCNNVAALENIKLEADALKLRLLNEMSRRDELLRVTEQQKSYDTNKPVVKTKKRKTLSIKNLVSSHNWEIESEKDLENHIEKMKAEILKSLEENTIVNIEF